MPCAEHQGLILVRADPEGEPIDGAAHLGEFDCSSSSSSCGARSRSRGHSHRQSNWKFALDTYGEGYHFKALHGSTIGQTHYSNRNLYERFGRHHRVNFPDLSVGKLVGVDERSGPSSIMAASTSCFPIR